MASIGWRRFRFFDDVQHTDASLPDSVTATCSGQEEEIWLGCEDGLIVCLDRNLDVKVTFPAFRGHVFGLLIEGVGRLHWMHYLFVVVIFPHADGWLAGLTTPLSSLHCLSDKMNSPAYFSNPHKHF